MKTKEGLTVGNGFACMNGTDIVLHHSVIHGNFASCIMLYRLQMLDIIKDPSVEFFASLLKPP